MTEATFIDQFKVIAKNGLGTPILVIALLAMMILPLPPFMLDFFFTFNIILALIVLLATVYASRPLDFAVFPTVLLVATLLRLTLNVASTRVVLLNGHTGTDAAGQVIESFGEVVIGGNYAVGLVIFAILVVINFVVVTKGAGRVSEVSARFTLDAMPGKQMAIDADLNAGLLTQEEAKIRRQEVAKEADFYGAMDGASKFVRGDAIAGILILFINIAGGLIIGMVQHSLSFADATHNYILLTIGDGLVAQIPSLILSTAAAILVTRVSSAQDMGAEVVSQLLANDKVLIISAAVLVGLGIIPGMPHIPFLFLASVSGFGAYQIGQKKRAAELAPVEAEQPKAEQAEQEEAVTNKEVSWDDVAAVDILGLEVGYRLIPLVDKKQGGQLLDRIKGIRKKISSELGFLVPSVHIRDNLDLSPNQYRITLNGVAVAQSELYIEKQLAINPGQVFGELSGIKTKDPAFGLEAVWIDAEHREQAQTMGYTAVDVNTVVATHLSELIKGHADDLIGYEEVQQMIDRLSKSAPKLVEELIPDLLSIGQILKVLQRLLAENISVRDFRSIAETLADTAAKSKDIDVLVDAVRISLRNQIVEKINGLNEELPVITLNPNLEQLLQNTLNMGNGSNGTLEPSMTEKMQQSLQELSHKQELSGQPAILLVQPALRKLMTFLTKSAVSSLHILSYHEIPEQKKLRIVGTVG